MASNYPSRRPNPAVLRQFETCIRKLQDARSEYEHTALGNTLIAFHISQTIHTLKNLERDLYLN